MKKEAKNVHKKLTFKPFVSFGNFERANNREKELVMKFDKMRIHSMKPPFER